MLLELVEPREKNKGGGIYERFKVFISSTLLRCGFRDISVCFTLTGTERLQTVPPFPPRSPAAGGCYTPETAILSFEQGHDKQRDAADERRATTWKSN